MVKSKQSSWSGWHSSGLLKLLPDEWIVQITLLFNMVFFQHYPGLWSMAKMFTIYKKGEKLSTDNYRGKSILVTLAKVYDATLTQNICIMVPTRPRTSVKGEEAVQSSS